MNKWRKSIFYQLTLAFLGLGLLPLAIAGLVLYVQFRGNMEQVMLKDMSHMVAYSVQNINEMVRECNELTKLIYDRNTEDNQLFCQLLKNQQLSDYQKRLQINVLLQQVLESDSRVRSVYFQENAGDLYYVTSNTQKVLKEEKLKEWLKADGNAQDSKGMQMFATHKDDYFPESGNQVITCSRAYKDVSSLKNIQNEMGRIYVDVDLSKLSSVLSSIDMGSQGIFRIVDPNGTCIYSTSTKEIGTAAILSGADISVFQNGSGSRLKQGRYQIYSQIEGSSWLAFAEVAQDSLMQNLNLTRRNILLFLGVSFCVLLLLYQYFYKKMKRPVAQLEAGMQAIQKGDLTTRVPLDREDELGLLANGLNQMAEELENHIKKVYVAEIKQQEAELTALKSQIQPHYLYNTLDVIRMMALEHKDTETAGMVESLSRQLKYLIGYNSDLVPLHKEIDNIREYFVIMRVRYENQIHLEVSIDEAVMNCAILKLSLQPIVENAVKHGLRPKEEGGVVRMEAYKQGEQLEIMVMDDGVGMKEEELQSLLRRLNQETIGVRTEDGWKHVGLKNAYDRIQKKFGTAYGMEIISNEGIGTMVIYHLPLMEEFLKEADGAFLSLS